MHNISLTSTEYQSFRDEITKRIRSAQYEALIDEQLLCVAEERLQSLDPKDFMSFEEVCREAGISQDELDQMDEVELE